MSGTDRLLGNSSHTVIHFEITDEATPRNNIERCFKNAGICALSILVSIIAITTIGATFDTEPQQQKNFMVVALAASAFAVVIVILGLARRGHGTA
jgi:Kef-type K+ transport system membrane component KefB